jgi:hypothetical protein
VGPDELHTTQHPVFSVLNSVTQIDIDFSLRTYFTLFSSVQCEVKKLCAVETTIKFIYSNHCLGTMIFGFHDGSL